MSDSRTLKPAIDDLVTRGIAPSDAATAAELSEELGYPVAPEEMKKRIESLAEFTIILFMSPASRATWLV